jgi:hypothetical protein
MVKKMIGAGQNSLKTGHHFFIAGQVAGFGCQRVISIQPAAKYKNFIMPDPL